MIGFSCSYTFVPPSDDSWGQKLNNGQWDGPIGMLTRKVPLPEPYVLVVVSLLRSSKISNRTRSTVAV